jgi:hypothetical protein
MVLGTVKDGRLRLPPLRGAFGIVDRPCAPLPPEGVGTGSVPTIDRPPAGRTGSGLTGGVTGTSRFTLQHGAGAADWHRSGQHRPGPSGS